MKPGDLVLDCDGDAGIVLKTVADLIRPDRVWIYYLLRSEIVADDMDNFEVIKGSEDGVQPAEAPCEVRTLVDPPR